MKKGKQLIYDGIVGIDLGTTNTVIAKPSYIRNKYEFEVVENLNGHRTTPSIVTFDGDDVIVGDAAKSFRSYKPESTVYGAKRLIGHKTKDPEVQKLFENAPFQIIEDAEGYPLIKIENPGKKPQLFKPEQISALVLGEVKPIIKMKGAQSKHCVISVPAYFSNLQREATKVAAQIAGLNCIKIVNEPTAAAIAFQHVANFQKGTVLVFDFGGGTLDVSIMNVDGNKYTVKAVSGDTSLGGEDIDVLLMNEMVKRFMEKNPGLDPRSDHRSMALLRIECEQAKCVLSSNVQTSITIAPFFKGKDLNEELTRSDFTFIADDILTRLTEPIETAIEQAKMSSDDITHIIMVGGSSHIPIARENVKDYFCGRIEPLNIVNPDEAVALGAAIIGFKIVNNLVFTDASGSVPLTSSKHKEIPSDEGQEEEDGLIEIVDVPPISIGILNGKTKFQPFIIRNQPLPQFNKYTFKTTKDYQTTATVVIYQGEDEIAINNILLGKFKLSGLPSRLAGHVLVNVTMEVNSNGILNVSADCIDEDIRKDVTLCVPTRFNEAEMTEAMLYQKKLMDLKDANLTYARLLSEIKTSISTLKTQGKKTEQYELAYNNYSSNIPTGIDVLNRGIEKLKMTLSHLKSEIKP